MPAPAPVFRGADFAEGKTTFSFDPRRGGLTRRYFEGTQAQIVAQANALRGLGYATEIETGPKWTLSATYEQDLSEPTPPEPEPQWEIHGASFTRNLLECVESPLVKDFSTATRSAIEYRLKTPLSEKPVVDFAQLDDPNVIKNAVLVYSMMRMGIMGKLGFSQIVSRTITVSRDYVPTWSITNVGKVLSREKLISTYFVPSYVTPLLSTSRYETLPIKDLDNTTYNLDLYYGFLEQYPTYQTVSQNRIQVRQEWIYDRFAPIYEVLP